KLHLAAGTPVAVGAFDAHMGAVGGGVQEAVLVKVMGTSTCDMIVGRSGDGPEHLVKGICGQVQGSIVPEMLGYEAGQSAFGDVYAWFKSLLMWPVETLLPRCSSVDSSQKKALQSEISEKIMENLEKEAAKVDPNESAVLALDWFNGRRTPDADQRLKSAITGLTLGTSAPAIYRALIEGTAFGARAIVERFKEESVAIKKVVAIGGIPHKSELVMQIVSDVLEMPIEIPASEQTVALGTAMFASVVAGINTSVAQAQQNMKSPIWRTVHPQKDFADLYETKYAEYKKFGAFVEREAL
ncbi:MAG: ribulokinase, partial [Spirochaetaceae bacterium]|nr:ribulokinase [Spirochaetaceae bacterium]